MKRFQPPYPLLLRKWLHRPLWQQHLILLLGMGLMAYFPVMELAQRWHQRQQLEAEHLTSQQELAHKQQILNSLKQQSDQALLTPALANRLLPINQRIQQATQHGLKLQYSHWEFRQTPLLRLELQGRFSQLHSFLIDLLQSNPSLSLLTLNIHKANEPEENTFIQSEIEFQLIPSKEQPEEQL